MLFCQLYFPERAKTADTFSPNLTELRLELRGVNLGVNAAGRQQLLMGPLLRRAPLVQHQDAVRPPDGGEAVGNDKAAPWPG